MTNNMNILYTGPILEGPSNITYFPDLTPLPIELKCNVTGIPIWIVNGSAFSLYYISNGALPGHSRKGWNILVNRPVNNTEYICLSARYDDDTLSDPAYIIIAGT